jgi:hypothetical protein
VQLEADPLHFILLVGMAGRFGHAVTPSDPGIDARVAHMLQEVLRRTHLSAAADLATIVAEEARALGAGAVLLYLIDYEQRLLMPLPGTGAAGREPLAVSGTVAGRAFATTDIIDVEADGGRRLLLPLLDGTERLGVLEATFPDHADPLPAALAAPLERLAHLVAISVVAKSAYSDFFELQRRRGPMTMASELLWALVPPLVFAGDDFVLAALLEPCYDAGGDAFDYSLNGRVLHFAVLDAMGHGLTAAGMSAFALSAYRHRRRRGDAPAAAYNAIDAALFEQFPTSSRFVTAVFAELDLDSGRLSWVSAGHPAPLLLREGRVVKTLHGPPMLPLGLRLADEPGVAGEESLEPGDMVLLYTDGLTEARRPGGELFTVERLGRFIEREAASGLAAPEVLRRLRAAIIERREGALRDDATALLVEWRRGGERLVVPATV